MKNENNELQANLTTTMNNNELLATQISGLGDDNAALKQQLDELNQMVVNLQATEEELKTSVQTLAEKINDTSDDATKGIIAKVEQLRDETRTEISEIVAKIANLETNLKQAPKFGIFSYLEKEDQIIFIKAVDDAVAQEKTFAKINEYLSNNLSPELDKIIKAHPALSKTYIKNCKKD